jgi:hypothetical protein
MEKGFNTICMMVGVFLLTMLLVLGWSAPTRKALFDYGAKSFLSEEDAEAIKDPQAATKKAHEKMMREAWDYSQKNQPTWNPNQPMWNPNQPTWNQNSKR